jgi:hypothetical protein
MGRGGGVGEGSAEENCQQLSTPPYFFIKVRGFPSPNIISLLLDLGGLLTNFIKSHPLQGFVQVLFPKIFSGKTDINLKDLTLLTITTSFFFFPNRESEVIIKL